VIVAGSGATAKIAAYDSTQELLSDTAVVFNHNGTGRLPALDRLATRIVVSNDTATNVYDASFHLLGSLPAATQAYVVNSLSVGANPWMSISLDDRTVFLAGPTQVVVQPVP
jgi:UDP-N-acetylglucosamine transferase subunit ALG13